MWHNNHMKVMKHIHATSNRTGETIRTLGEKAGELARDHIAADKIEIPDELWEEIEKL